MSWTASISLLLCACLDPGPDHAGSDAPDNTDGGTEEDTHPSDTADPSDGVTDVDSDGYPEDEDCNDRNWLINPGATELCDAVDNDCDGEVDESDAADAVAWYVDVDEDGYGDVESLITSCEPVKDRILDSTDCDDSDPEVHPGAEDPVGDDVDQDCSRSLGPLTDDASSVLHMDASIWYTLAGAGDMDGDGLPDLAVGLYQGEPATVYLASVLRSGELALADVAVAVTGQVDDYTGYAIAGVGDASGDGLDDLLVGAPLRPVAAGSTGAVFLMAGPLLDATTTDDHVATVQGDGDENALGAAVAHAGDTDGDGLSEVLIGDPGQLEYGPNREGPGRAYLFQTPLAGTLSVTDADASMYGRYTEDQAGFAVAAAGDTDGDGYGDILVGAPEDIEGGDDAGAAFLIRGPVSGDQGLADADAIVIGSGYADAHSCRHSWQTHAGYDVLGPGDMDGDGLDDVVLGSHAPSCSHSDRGYVALFTGPLYGTLEYREPDAFLNSRYDLGEDLVGPGDMNGDGLADLLLPEEMRGALLLHGAPAHPTEDWQLVDQIRYFDGIDWNVTAAALGDADGNGWPDVAIGDRGEVYIFLTNL
ncbi:FG-GAP-like repeat-containing protein [Myxococcota bacterium]|nr:FG-GAP-like repeat-containing protein [Myxococcota bacterium]